MEAPRIELEIRERQEIYAPGDTLQFHYQVLNVSPAGVAAVEASVLWHTEGKGDEDLGVHFFDRRTADHAADLRGPALQSVPLPNSPLSYDGMVVKIRWCVRVRAFLRKEWKGRALNEDAPFRLLARRTSEDRAT